MIKNPQKHPSKQKNLVLGTLLLAVPLLHEGFFEGKRGAGAFRASY